MKIAPGMAAAAALLAAGAAQAQQRAKQTQAELFCHDLKRVVKAASYETAFKHLERARAAPPLFGFRPGACRAYAGTETSPAAWDCHQHLAPAHLSLDSLAAATAECLPEAEQTRGRWGREATFTLPGARILINESGGPRAKVGRIVGYRVEAVRQAVD